ncbi:MAG: hypothetical protein WC761_02150 [Candidatus Paceibacterota bacterium]
MTNSSLIAMLLGAGIYLALAGLLIGLWNISIGSMGGPSLGFISGLALFTLVNLVCISVFGTCLNLWRSGEPVTYTLPLKEVQSPPVEKYFMINEDLELVETTKEYLVNLVAAELERLAKDKINNVPEKTTKENAASAPNEGSHE